MNVSLGKKWEQFVEEKLKTGDYQSASDLVRAGLRLIEQRDLMAQSRKVASFEELQDALLAGVRSGPATPMTKGDWKLLRAEVASFAKKRSA